MTLEDIRNERIKKLTLLKKAGLVPYAPASQRTTTISDLLKDFDTKKDGRTVTVAGRVLAIRGHGGIIFCDVWDGTGKIQGYLHTEELSEEKMKLFNDTVDVGDFIDISGNPGTTKRGEKSIVVRDWIMLAKSLRTLPEKWVGLTDSEERLRRRYLDFISHPELKELFEKKAKFWDVTRTFLKDRGFLEVETPTLEITTGGAEARPFKTHHNDFDIDVFLRISVGELWQKRLMSAGIPRTFEIGRVYRNEGSSLEHLQEFTNMELYASYMSFEEGKELIKELYRAIAQEVFGTTKFETRGHTFDLSDEWEELDYVSTVENMTGVNIFESSEKELKDKLIELGVQFEGETRERLIDSLWKYCRKSISGPSFLVNHPKIVAPLSQEHPDDPRKTLTLQIIMAGSEMGRAHGELNNPLDQAQRFEEQGKLIERGDEEAMMPDFEFVEMMEYGMPPCFGFGFGERLFAFMVDKPVRETQIFPLMRPRREQ
jgi:lysyl-tRNA synthetase class 2